MPSPLTAKLREEIKELLCDLLKIPCAPNPTLDQLVDKLMQCAMLETLSSIQKHGTVYSALKQI